MKIKGKLLIHIVPKTVEIMEILTLVCYLSTYRA